MNPFVLALTIIACMFVLVVVVERCRRRKGAMLDDQIDRQGQRIGESNPEPMDDLTVLIATRDPVKVHAAANLLRENDIVYSVLDCHMSRMLPTAVDIRIMVRGRDVEECVRLLESAGIPTGFDA